MAEIAANCYYLSQGWWSYELCAGHHLRQFHALPEQGKVESVLTLGTYDAQVHISGPYIPTTQLAGTKYW